MSDDEVDASFSGFSSQALEKLVNIPVFVSEPETEVIKDAEHAQNALPQKFETNASVKARKPVKRKKYPPVNKRIHLDNQKGR